MMGSAQASGRGSKGRAALAGVQAVAALAILLALCPQARATSVAVTGPGEVVFDWTTMRCENLDIPDGPAQPIRDSLGRIQVVTPSFSSRRLIGPDFDHLTRDCSRILFNSDRDPDPAHFDDAHWLRGLYTENGTDIYALVHNEYHGFEHPGGCPTGSSKCVINGVTYAYSHDSGDTWSQPPPPSSFVATLPARVSPDIGRFGFFSPSNPIKRGSYLYSMMITTGNKGEDSGVCVMRTKDITDPTSWRGWDGGSFSVRFTNPYYETMVPEQQHLCEPVSPDQILQMQRSVIYDTYLGKYVVTGTSFDYDPAQSRYVRGFYFSTSDDLVNWTQRQLLMEGSTPNTYQCGQPDPVAYPSLIDQTSSDPNFRIAGRDLYVYFTQFHYDQLCHQTLDRDLVRVPIEFSQ